MELEIKNKNNSVKLSDIKVGETFKITDSNGNRYMKINLSCTEYVNMSSKNRDIVVNLETGDITCPIKDLKVTRVKSKVTCRK